MDIEVVVDGEVFKVGSIILEQHSLKKPWEDIKDICFHSPIRWAEYIKFKVMLP